MSEVDRAALAALLSGLLAACPGSPPIDQANPCANGPPGDEPSACPSPQPSYKTDVLPVLQTKCLLCHSPADPDGGPNSRYSSPYDFSTYALQLENKGTLLTDILICKMPNLDAGATPLDEAERLTLMDWLVCGAPDN